MWEAYVGTMKSYVGRAKKHTHVERGNHMSLSCMRSDNAHKIARVCVKILALRSARQRYHNGDAFEAEPLAHDE
jgi:hypothetical protein